MERFQEARDKSRRYMQAADHMASVTYPLLQDNKVLVAALENTFLALTNAMASVLHYERTFKRVPPFHDNFESKFLMFSEKCAKRYGIETQYLQMMQEIKDILLEHKESQMEFSKKDSLVIVNEGYRLRKVSVEQIKNYIARSKNFVGETEKIVSKHERIFK